MTIKTLTFKFSCELDNGKFIEEGTKVEVYRQKENSTWIIYNGQPIEFMNCSFEELS